MSMDAQNIQKTKIISLLRQTYPKAKIALRYRTHWELLVAVILSAQCTDVMVNKVTEKLFAKYKTLDDYTGADAGQFEQDIRPTGFYRNKAKNILACARILRDSYDGIIPKTMKEILTFPGVARKTANVVLGNAYGVVEGIAVDTHVLRLSQRLRLADMNKIGGKKLMTFVRNNMKVADYTKDADPDKIERQLMSIIPKNDRLRFTYSVIEHGRTLCKARNPQCMNCPLSKYCRVSRV
jgi:endonuclease-3